MFTGIVFGKARIEAIDDCRGVRTLEINFPEGFCEALEVGASVSIDGVCLSVTEILSSIRVKFDVVLQSLMVTTLSQSKVGDWVNVERAAKDGAEIGGHPISGHIDFSTQVTALTQIENNYRLRLALPEGWQKYVFAKGYIAINGASLTVSQVNKDEGSFELWLIPETRRVTTFRDIAPGDWVNIEISRETQVVVDTIQTTLQESFGSLLPVFEQLLLEKGIDLPETMTAKLATLQPLAHKAESQNL